MSKLTPGPWSIEGDADDAEASIVNREHSGMDWDVCTVHSSAANARLISAAPDLLQALKQAVEALRSGDPNARMNALRDCPPVVSKATGEPQ